MAEHGAVSSVLLRMNGSWPLSAAAREFAAAGVPVFPCTSYGKRPATEHGFHDATTNLDQIEAWWRQSPGANIGVPTGAVPSTRTCARPFRSSVLCFIRAVTSWPT